MGRRDARSAPPHSSIFLALLMLACASPRPPQVVPPVPETPREVSITGTARVTASALNVRSGASADEPVITRVRRGTKLELLAERSGWLKVRLANGEIGWVSAQHVSRGDETGSRRRGGCPPDSDFSFVKTPVPAFSDRGAHGLVVVEASVNTSGEVTSTRVLVNTTGDEKLAELAQKEIRSARFRAPVLKCAAREFIYTYKRSF